MYFLLDDSSDGAEGRVVDTKYKHGNSHSALMTDTVDQSIFLTTHTRAPGSSSSQSELVQNRNAICLSWHWVKFYQVKSMEVCLSSHFQCELSERRSSDQKTESWRGCYLVSVPLFFSQGSVTPRLFGYLALPEGSAERKLEGGEKGNSFSASNCSSWAASLLDSTPARHSHFILTPDT